MHNSSLDSMNVRKYKTDPEELLRKGKEIMKYSDESKYFFRVFCVNMVVGGSTAQQVAQSGGVSSVSVSNWVKSVDEHGFESLQNKKIPGRPKKLSENIIAEIDSVLQNDPNKYGLKVWDGPSLSSYIYDKYGIEYSVRQCQRLFHKLGYSKIRPRSFPSKGNENSDARNAFKKK